MSGWASGGGRPTCCQRCERRAPGCHSVDRCADWAAEVARRKEEKARREAASEVTRIDRTRRRTI
ncbi:MAG: hypothetical protein J6K32_08220 [Clostridia bacterium]|nr:hypothetical protein [Clostridia bacterium]